ncbi:MAG: FHA domain-containing protein [Pseudomonadota bacterium]
MTIRWLALIALLLIGHGLLTATAQVKSLEAAPDALLRIELFDPETGRSNLLGMGSHIGNGNVLTSSAVIQGQLLSQLRVTSLGSENALLVDTAVFEDSRLAVLTVQNTADLGLNYFALSAQGVAPRTDTEGSDPAAILWTIADRSLEQSAPTIVSVAGGTMGLNADLNYSAVGAPVLNQCGHVIGVVEPGGSQVTSEAQSFAGQLPPVLMSGPHRSISVDRLKSALSASNVAFTTGEAENCVTPHFLEWDRIRKAEQEAADAAQELAAAERQLAEVRAETLRQEAIAAAAEERAAEALRLQEEAERQAGLADEKRIEAEAAEDEARQGEAEARQGERDAIDARDRADRTAEVNSGFGRWTLYLSGIVVALILLATLLMVLRSRRTAKLSSLQTANLQKILDRSLHGDKIFLTDASGRRIAIDGVGLADPELGLIIGRNSKQSDIPIQGEDVSRRHAKLFVTDEGLFIEDIGSENGTSLNNTRLSAYQPKLIKHDDMVGFANQWFKIVFQSRDK